LIIDNINGENYNMLKCAYGGIGMHNLVKAVKALSEDNRLRIINLLLVRECCVCEVVQALGISQTRASRNLNMLYDAGFLKLRKERLWSLYSLDRENMPEYLMKLVEAVELALADNKLAREDRERLKVATRGGAGCIQIGYSI
jgi:ArsR family transcriptional regulator, arsenate/arsenite/antimonite-responsive transcriptional repressor